MVKAEEIYFKGKDERGLTGEVDSGDRSGKYILAYRKKGSVSGRHYHKGLVKEKNPEILFLLQGKVKINYAALDEAENLLQMNSKKVNAPARIEVEKNCWHEMIFLEDACFLELNSFEQGDKDTFRLNTTNNADKHS